MSHHGCRWFGVHEQATREAGTRHHDRQPASQGRMAAVAHVLVVPPRTEMDAALPGYASLAIVQGREEEVVEWVEGQGPGI